MEFEGTVFQILPAVSGTSARGEWQRQDVVFELQDGSSFARKAAVTFFNKPNDVASLKIGAAYVVSFNIESREYQGRYYTNITAWRVQPKQMDAAPAAEQAPAYSTPAPAAAPSFSASADKEVDDLPF